MSDELCAFCRRQFSCYTCPKCNAPYCSMICFKSNVHGDCSEAFYKNELQSGIQSSATASHQERVKMLEILKRFEEESPQEPTDFLEEEDDLVSRLGDLDISNMPPEKVWDLLKPEERTRFIEAINDPSSDLAQSLLATQHPEPWWEKSETSTASSLMSSYASEATTHDLHFPKVILIPLALLSAPLDTSHPFPIWNLVAVFMAYAYCVRHLGLTLLGSSVSDFPEALRIISQLTPFLIDKSSQTALMSLENTITDLWSRFKPENVSQDLFRLLLKDVELILRPLAPIVTPINDSQESTVDTSFVNPLDPLHPHARAILAISDLQSLFEAGSGKPTVKTRSAVHKLRYYAMHTMRVPSSILMTVIEEIRAKIQEYEQESSMITGRITDPKFSRLLE